MMNIAESIAIPGKDGQPRGAAARLHSVGVFSLEMSKEQIGLRILSSESGISNHLIRAGMLSEKLWVPSSLGLKLKVIFCSKESESMATGRLVIRFLPRLK